jgi:hypothetical protein
VSEVHQRLELLKKDPFAPDWKCTGRRFCSVDPEPGDPQIYQQKLCSCMIYALSKLVFLGENCLPSVRGMFLKSIEDVKSTSDRPIQMNLSLPCSSRCVVSDEYGECLSTLEYELLELKRHCEEFMSIVTRPTAGFSMCVDDFERILYLDESSFPSGFDLANFHRLVKTDYGFAAIYRELIWSMQWGHGMINTIDCVLRDVESIRFLIGSRQEQENKCSKSHASCGKQIDEILRGIQEVQEFIGTLRTVMMVIIKESAIGYQNAQRGLRKVTSKIRKICF